MRPDFAEFFVDTRIRLDWLALPPTTCEDPMSLTRGSYLRETGGFRSLYKCSSFRSKLKVRFEKPCIMRDESRPYRDHRFSGANFDKGG